MFSCVRNIFRFKPARSCWKLLESAGKRQNNMQSMHVHKFHNVPCTASFFGPMSNNNALTDPNFFKTQKCS